MLRTRQKFNKIDRVFSIFQILEKYKIEYIKTSIVSNVDLFGKILGFVKFYYNIYVRTYLQVLK